MEMLPEIQEKLSTTDSTLLTAVGVLVNCDSQGWSSPNCEAGLVTTALGAVANPFLGVAIDLLGLPNYQKPTNPCH